MIDGSIHTGVYRAGHLAFPFKSKLESPSMSVYRIQASLIIQTRSDLFYSHHVELHFSQSKGIVKLFQNSLTRIGSVVSVNGSSVSGSPTLVLGLVAQAFPRFSMRSFPFSEKFSWVTMVSPISPSDYIFYAHVPLPMPTAYKIWILGDILFINALESDSTQTLPPPPQL